MSTPSQTRKRTHKALAKERRAPADASAGSIHKLRGLLARPIGLQRRDGRLHVVLVDRRRPEPPDPWLAPLQAELNERLLAQQFGPTAQAMRHLCFVHDALQSKGWPAVSSLPAHVLGRAIVQAEMLAGDEPSPGLKRLVERLRPLQLAAAEREERAARSRDLVAGEQIEVSEATHEEFDAVERSWVGRVPPESEPPDLDA